MKDNPLTDFASSSWTDIDRDPNLWDTYITNEIKKITGARNVDITIIWSNKNDKKGYALGTAAVIDPSTKNKFSIPLIIKEYKIAPLDHMFAGKDVALKFTPDNSDLVLGGTNLAMGVLSPQATKELPGSGSMEAYPQAKSVQWETKTAADWSIQYLLDFMKIAESTPRNHMTILPLIAGDISKSAYGRVVDAMKEPEVLSKFAGRKYVFIETLQSPQFIGKKTLTEAEDPMFEAKPPIETVVKLAPNRYLMMSSSPENFTPIMQDIDGITLRMQVRKRIPDQTQLEQMLSAIDASGKNGYILSDINMGNPLAMARQQFNPKPITKTGFYALWDEERKENIPVLVVCRAYNPDGEQSGPDSRKIVITSEGKYAIIDTDLSSVPVVPFDLSVHSIMNTGDEGIFLYLLKDSTDQTISPIIAVGPLRLKSRSVTSHIRHESPSVGDQTTYPDGIHTFESLKGGETFRCEFDSYVRALGGVRKPWRDEEKSDSSNNKFILPGTYNWVYFHKEGKFSSFKDPNDAIKKEASVVTYASGEYRIENSDLGEWNGRFLQPHMAKFALAALGAQEQAREIIMKEAQENGKAYVSGLQFVPQKEASASSLTKWIDMVHDKWDFVKLAAAFDDIATVDSVLGLNFLSRANINKFVSVLPKLKEARADAIRLLYVARLGATELDEESIIQTIDGLDEVILGLDKLKLRMDLLI